MFFYNPSVTLHEFDCVRDTTRSYLQATMGILPPAQLASYTETVASGNLNTLISNIPVTGNEKRGLVVHYGMAQDPGNGPLRMKFGLEPVKLVPAGDHTTGPYWRSVPVPGMFYDTGLNTRPKQAWLNTYASQYKSWVRIRRQNADPQLSAFVQDRDVEHVVFHYEDAIQKFIQDNPNMQWIVLFALAEPTLREELSSTRYVTSGWRQITAMVGLDAARDTLLNDANVPGAGTFHMRALNLASPCPPLCKGAAFPTHGMRGHPGC